MMRPCKAFRTIACVLSMSAVLAGCGTATPARPCAGFTANNLSPAGFVALVGADRGGAERVAANDRNGKRRGCW